MEETPNKLWWLGHVVFWIITGLICYILWKDRNEQAARKHLIHSIWIGFVGPIVIFIIGFVAAIMFGTPI